MRVSLNSQLFLGALFIDLLKMVLVPLVFTSIAVGVACSATTILTGLPIPKAP